MLSNNGQNKQRNMAYLPKSVCCLYSQRVVGLQRPQVGALISSLFTYVTYVPFPRAFLSAHVHVNTWVLSMLLMYVRLL